MTGAHDDLEGAQLLHVHTYYLDFELWERELGLVVISERDFEETPDDRDNRSEGR